MWWVRPGSAHRPPGAWAEARKMAFPAEASDRLRGRDRDLKGQRSPGTVRILCGRVGTLNSWLPLSLRPGGMSLALRQPSRPAFPKMAVETLPCAARMALGESTFPRPHVTSRHLTSPRELSLLSLCELDCWRVLPRAGRHLVLLCVGLLHPLMERSLSPQNMRSLHCPGSALTPSPPATSENPGKPTYITPSLRKPCRVWAGTLTRNEAGPAFEEGLAVNGTEKTVDVAHCNVG